MFIIEHFLLKVNIMLALPQMWTRGESNPGDPIVKFGLGTIPGPTSIKF